MTICEIICSHTQDVLTILYINDNKIKVIKSHTYTLKNAINIYCEVNKCNINKYYKVLNERPKV